MTHAVYEMFTAEQIAAMHESRKVIDLLDEATRGKEGGAASPGLAAMLGLVTLRRSLEDMSVSLIRIDGEEDGVKRFGSNFSMDADRGGALVPYRQLDVIPFGWITTAEAGDGSKEHYRTYRIHQPGLPLHGLGVILAYTITHVRETLSREQVLEEMGLPGMSAVTGRLYTAAAHADNPERAEQLERLADAALTQTEIKSDTYYHDNRRIVDAQGARYLSTVMQRVMQADRS